MKRILSVLLALSLMLSLSVNNVFANNVNESDNSNNITVEVEEWKYNPAREAELPLFNMDLAESIASGGGGGGSAADIVKVNVTATNKSTGLEEKVENANVRLFVGATEKVVAKTNSEGVAEISLAGLSLEDRLTATISADKVVSLGKAINGTARDALFNNYPKDTEDLDGDGNTSEYIRYQTELHSEWIDRNGNWNGMALPKTVESNKVDIVFAIDATGSMGDEINNVKDNVAAFSKNLIDKGLDIRFSIIEYRDITCSEPTINHKNSSGSNWYSDIDSVVEVLGNIYVNGGGDRDETPIDALGMMADKDNMSWRSDAHKFAFVLTDAGYKVNNNYGYENLDDVIRTLAGMKVVTSVITSTGNCQSVYRPLYETTEGIFANINAYDFDSEMLALSDSIATSVTREIDLVLSEPRLLVNMSVGYLADDSTSRTNSYKNAVKNVINEYAHRIAETSDGHVLIDKVIINNTNSRLNFYNTSDVVSMTDIHIESTESSSVRIGSNAHLAGFYTADSYAEDITKVRTPFKNIPDSAKIRQAFQRIQMSGTIGGGWNNSFINDPYPYSTALTHETGHYLFNFFDEYLNASNSRWADVGGRPYSNYGLMDHHRGDAEMSKTDIDYAYMNDGFSAADKSIHTYQSWIYKASCEDLLAGLLTNENADDYYGKKSKTDFHLGNYKATYTKVMDKVADTEEAKDRRSPYSYAELDMDDDFIDLTRSGAGRSFSLMDTDDIVPSTYFDDIEKTSASVAGFVVKGNALDVKVTLSPVSDYTYELYYIKASDEEFSKVEISEEADKLIASVPVAIGELVEIRLVAVKDGKKEYNSYFVDRSEVTDAGYFYSSADGSVMAYVVADEESTYTFTADNTSYKNGEYVSVNQATVVDSDNDVTIDSGEIYSVASYMAEIDYSTIKWFKFKDGIWTALDTDYSEEENMNIGARADLDGEGIYVLMAKGAPVGEVSKATSLTYTKSSDRDAVVTLNFEDSNSDSKYYNVYYGEKEFEDKNDEGIICRTFDADGDDITLNLIERNRVVYAAVEIVAENGSRSELSDLIKLEAGEADSDGDGIPDWYCDKYRLWGRADEAKDIANSDDDGDGLTNLEEYKGGSDPTNPNDPEHTTNVAVQALEISPATKEVYIGSIAKLTAVITPENATNKNVRWSVEDESIASITVDGGSCTVQGIIEGTTTVYAVSVDGGYSASAQITVLQKPSYSGGGGGGGLTSSYTVKFETNGGSKVANKSVSKNRTIEEPAAPEKDGFTFAGWYTDKELTEAYDFNAKVTKGFTLYAKWEEVAKPQIILTIGDKEAIVFGETKANDVAPEIVNDRTMLPIRFIAESLGAEVKWDADARKVTIIKGETEIVIEIDSDTAKVNDKEVKLDSAAYIKNDRTYLPLRFVSENLGAMVEWVEDTQQVIITK